jgi:hypothetical protein
MLQIPPSAANRINEAALLLFGLSRWLIPRVLARLLQQT